MKIKEILELSALFLGIVNGWMLLKNYLNDRPKLKVHPVHPDVYQWWFTLPGETCKDGQTRRYGFLVYVGIANSGLRKVSLDSWRLFIPVLPLKQVELRSVNIPEPHGKIGKSGNVKIYPVLGQRGEFFEGNTLIEPGASIIGMAYYTAEFYGTETWNPIIKDNKIEARFIIKDVFGNKKSTKVVFSEVSLDWIKSIIEGIENIR